MRLKLQEIETLKKSVRNIDNKAKLYLFGSRCDDSKKGGDIDLLLVSSKITKENIRKIKREFMNKFGEQKIDLLCDDGTMKSPFVQMISSKAILL